MTSSVTIFSVCVGSLDVTAEVDSTSIDAVESVDEGSEVVVVNVAVLVGCSLFLRISPSLSGLSSIACSLQIRLESSFEKIILIFPYYCILSFITTYVE